MSAAKLYKKPPIVIAKEVSEILKESSDILVTEVVMPGFININLNNTYLSEIMNDMLHDKRCKLPKMEPKKIVVDFGGANIAKPLHVGHLRSAIIGDTLCRISRFLGHEVISDVHMGDWGLQMGLVIAEIKRLNPDLVYFDENYSGNYPEESPVTSSELNTIYPNASARSKVDTEFAALAAKITVELQKGKKGYVALWNHIRKVSIADLKINYSSLGVEFDKWLGESDADPYIPKVIKILEDKNLLKRSEGAMVVDVSLEDDNSPMPPMIIVKSNGGDVYGTTDLGTLLQRMTDWNPDEIWYIVDNRQALHFKQVFRCAKMADIIDDTTNCYHIPFGTMNGKDGKPYKTREGGVMRLSDMINDVVNNAYIKVNESNMVTQEDEKYEVARIVGISALKVGDLLNHRTKDFIFDMDRFLSYDGKTGPYLQYTAVRIKSILEKATSLDLHAGKILPPSSDTETELMLSLIATSDSVIRSFNEKAPNILCNSLFDITLIFNRFYGETKIITCEDNEKRGSWLALLQLTYNILEILLDLMSIKIPNKM